MTLPARVAMAMAALFALLLATLHAVRADLEPSAHMISEYAVGQAGWMMLLTFLALAAAYSALLLALRSFARGPLGALGLLLLLIAAVGAAMGGLFPMDPAGTPPEQASRSNALHGLGFMLGVPGTLLASTLLNIRLWRHPLWRSARPMLLGTAALIWLTLIVFAMAMAAFMKAPPGTPFAVGWQNRALVASWALWVFLLARRARAISSHGSP